jgi:non-ribosomal peptide synthetase component F
LAHQDVPFERVLDAVRPTRDLSRTPVFQVMLNLVPASLAARSVGELGVEPIAVDDVSAKFDLTLYVAHSNGNLAFHAVYASDLFRHESIEQLLGALESLFLQVIDDPEVRLSELSLVLPEGGHEAAAIEHFRRMYRGFTGVGQLGPRRAELQRSSTASHSPDLGKSCARRGLCSSHATLLRTMPRLR